MSKRLEGLPRHSSMHAAGVVIGQRALDDFVPLSRSSDGSITTQFTMTTLEELGLLKMDFLGLRTLTVIQDAQKLVNAGGDCKLPQDMMDIDYNDKAVLDSIGTGKTDGVFQLESAGMKSFMKELKPQSLEDIIAGISLYRPGPMDFIPQYIKGKDHPELITYDCPQLEPHPVSDLRLYRLSGTGHADRAGSGGHNAGTKRSPAPCHVQEKRGCDAGKSARTLSMEMKRWACRVVWQMELMRRSPIRSTMR